MHSSTQSIKHLFIKYVSQNILGMLGMSIYILADTFFISKAIGANGITALNLVLPIYNLIFAIGAMIGVGSAIRFSIARSQDHPEADHYFFNALFWVSAIGMIFMLLGVFFPGHIVRLLGGDHVIVSVGTTYTRIFMLFAPCFMWNHVCNAFVRNDGNPRIAMLATLLSSLFNVVMDYILMFPLGFGMAGAALATAFSPIVGVAICLRHFLSKENHVHLHMILPSITKLFKSCQVGIASFVGEISSGVITIVFNTLILNLVGNIGVAAYGVIANCALVAVSMFNGISQGSQPLLSKYHGSHDTHAKCAVIRYGLITALLIAAIMYIAIFFGASGIVSIFNSEQSTQMALYAQKGLRLYFIGFFFAGINIVGSGALSAIDAARKAFIISILRGFILIIASAFIMAFLLQLTGVWLAFPAAEFLTVLVTLYCLKSLSH